MSGPPERVSFLQPTGYTPDVTSDESSKENGSVPTTTSGSTILRQPPTKVARADVAVRTKTDAGDLSWEILEIKSSTEKSFRKKVPDLAYTVSLARLVGYHISKASLILVNPTYMRKSISIEKSTVITKATAINLIVFSVFQQAIARRKQEL